MINAQLWRDEGILVTSPADKLEATDFERLRLLTDPYIEEHGNLNALLINAESFFGWEDFSSMPSHIRFVRNYHKKIERVDAVTDNGVSRMRRLLNCPVRRGKPRDDLPMQSSILTPGASNRHCLPASS
jgi:SpoIIAA-like